MAKEILDVPKTEGHGFIFKMNISRVLYYYVKLHKTLHFSLFILLLYYSIQIGGQECSLVSILSFFIYFSSLNLKIFLKIPILFLSDYLYLRRWLVAQRDCVKIKLKYWTTYILYIWKGRRQVWTNYALVYLKNIQTEIKNGLLIKHRLLQIVSLICLVYKLL